MGYRLLVVLFAIFMIGGCAAFDSDNTPYVGFDPSIVPVMPGGVPGIHSGFYAGTLTLDSNECEGVMDEVGTSSDFAVDVIHVDNYINMTFEDGTVVAGELVGDSAVFMTKVGSTENVYYFTFSDESETITGSFEVIEPNDDLQYGDPCAVYSVAMEQGERPEGFGTGEVAEDEDSEESAEESPPEEESFPDVNIPWNFPGM